MTPVEKFEAMSAHSIALQELSMAGIRRRFPNASEEEVWLRAAALRIGTERFEEVTGHRFEW